MLVNISYKNWPHIVYVKFNGDKITDELFNEHKQLIEELIDKIKKYKQNNDMNMYVVLNVNDIGKINLKYAERQIKFYNYIIENVIKYIKFVFIIVKN